MTAIYKRELISYFITPIGYVYLAVFWLLAGYQFTVLILSGSGDLASEFSFLFTVVLLLTPILTMRLMSEDRRQKTDQILFSAPVTLPGIVAGKYFAAVTVYLMGIAITLVHAVVMAGYAPVNWAVLGGNILGISLMGMAGIAICMFVSAQTENQIIAAIGGLAAMLLVLALNGLAAMVPFPWLRTLLASISFFNRYHNLTLGLFRVADLMFFASFAGIFFFLTSRVLDHRRWSGR